MAYVTVSDIEALFRPLTADESARCEALIPYAEDTVRMEAKSRGKDIDLMLSSGDLYESVLKGVLADVIGRALMTSTNSEPMSQMSQSALGYSVSGTFLVPGGGLFIKRDELARLGLKRQRMQLIALYEDE